MNNIGIGEGRIKLDDVIVLSATLFSDHESFPYDIRTRHGRGAHMGRINADCLICGHPKKLTFDAEVHDGEVGGRFYMEVVDFNSCMSDEELHELKVRIFSRYLVTVYEAESEKVFDNVSELRERTENDKDLLPEDKESVKKILDRRELEIKSFGVLQPEEFVMPDLTRDTDLFQGVTSDHGVKLLADGIFSATTRPEAETEKDFRAEKELLLALLYRHYHHTNARPRTLFTMVKSCQVLQNPMDIPGEKYPVYLRYFINEAEKHPGSVAMEHYDYFLFCCKFDKIRIFRTITLLEKRLLPLINVRHADITPDNLHLFQDGVSVSVDRDYTTVKYFA